MDPTKLHLLKTHHHNPIKSNAHDTYIMWVSNCIIVRKEDNAILCDPNKHNIMLTHFLPKPFTQNYYSHQFFGKVYLSFNLVVDSSAFDSPHL